MKLISLEIDKYKNLSGTYDFNSQDGYIALIGENGSGKTNLLEVISLIFNGIYFMSLLYIHILTYFNYKEKE